MNTNIWQTEPDYRCPDVESLHKFYNMNVCRCLLLLLLPLLLPLLQLLLYYCEINARAAHNFTHLYYKAFWFQHKWSTMYFVVWLFVCVLKPSIYNIYVSSGTYTVHYFYCSISIFCWTVLLAATLLLHFSFGRWIDYLFPIFVYIIHVCVVHMRERFTYGSSLIVLE